MIATDVIRNVPLFSGLDARQLEDVLRIFQLICFQPGAALTNQGQAASSAFVVESGEADVMTMLPGGGQACVATLGPGSVVGEMALLDQGVRSATVVAREPTTVYFIERDGFRMLLAQRNDAAFAIQNRITVTLCRRLRNLNAQVMDYDGFRHGTPARTGPAPVAASRAPVSFDYRAFLPILPIFRDFDVEEIAEITHRAQAFELPRGAMLFRQGERGDACYVVLRGAVEVSADCGGKALRLGIIGPGRLLGYMGLIDGIAHGTTATAREHVSLLALDRKAFDSLCEGRTRTAAKFQDAINQNLLHALARTNNDLTRLISQARIRARGASTPQADVDALQRALCTQDCRAA